MKMRYLVVAVTAVLCLVFSLSLIFPTRSIPYPAGQYNPNADVNNDGNIDLFDALLLSNAFDTTGSQANG